MGRKTEEIGRNECKAMIESILKDIPDSTQLYFLVKKWNEDTSKWGKGERIDAFPDIDLSEEIHDRWGNGKYKITLYDQDDRRITKLAGNTIKSTVIRIGDEDEEKKEKEDDDENDIEEEIDDVFEDLADETLREIKLLKLQNLKKQLQQQMKNEEEGSAKYRDLASKITETERQLDEIKSKINEQGQKLVDSIRSSIKEESEKKQQQDVLMKAFSEISKQSQESQTSLFKLFQMMQNKDQGERKKAGSATEATMANTMAMMQQFTKAANESQQGMTQFMMMMMMMMQEQSKAAEKQLQQMQLQSQQLIASIINTTTNKEDKTDVMWPVVLEMIRDIKESSKKEINIKEIMAIPAVSSLIERLISPPQPQPSAIESALPTVIDNVTSTVTNITSQLAQQLLQDKPTDDPMVKKANTALYFLRSLTPEIVKIVQSAKAPAQNQQRNAKPATPNTLPAKVQPLQQNEYIENQNISQDEINNATAEIIEFVNQIEEMPVDEAINTVKTKYPNLIDVIKNNKPMTDQLLSLSSPKLKVIIEKIKAEV